MALFEQTWEIISTKTLTFIGIIGSYIEYKIVITTDAILATKWSWTTFTAWISCTYLDAACWSFKYTNESNDQLWFIIYDSIDIDYILYNAFNSLYIHLQIQIDSHISNFLCQQNCFQLWYRVYIFRYSRILNHTLLRILFRQIRRCNYIWIL